jgi:hypothetical protein
MKLLLHSKGCQQQTSITFVPRFLRRAMSKSFLKSQRLSAMLHVNNAIQRITKTDQPLICSCLSDTKLGESLGTKCNQFYALARGEQC